MNYSRRTLLSILLFGSIWGGLEAVVTASMEGVGEVVSRSVVLALIAVMVLSYARMALPYRGSILAIGLVAAGFKFLGLPNLYTCQLAGVVGQAIVLEILFSLVEMRQRALSLGAMAVLMLLSGTVNALVFCTSQAYLFQNHWWAERGFSGLMQWVATVGMQAALASVLGYGVAVLLSRSRVLAYTRLAGLKPVLFNGTVITVSTGCWTIGAILQRM
ncbi:MAG: hypothetical protein AB1644_04790 [Candidatus Zixiibacteriota bacterium]